jgi:peptidoglycan hydrolase-like protein with peptidoglycan-binding domain
VVDPEELRAIEDGEYDLYDMDDETPADVEDIDSTVKMQQALLTIYGKNALPRYGADGGLGPETSRAVRHFQQDWNKNKPADSIKEDGIPGTQTWDRLEKALAMGQGFNARAFD